MNEGVIPITNLQLAFSIVLVLLAGGVSAALRLGLLKSLLWGTIRTVAQLTLIGYALVYIFALENLPLVIVIILFMCAIAARTASRHTKDSLGGSGVLAFIALLASTFLVGTIVVVLIIGPEPWYSARIAIPIFGMILGNSMNGIALSLDRLYSEVRARTGEIEALLTFGATPWEAVRDCIRKAMRAGMTPTVNSLMVVGLVSLPGMMTGQILGGVDPVEAVRYQIVVMLMIAAAVALGCLLLVGMSYRRLFNRDGALIREVRGSR
ncbi:MAG: iron export ABC transporter permease subunit FetB [Bacillota bacterium]